jgi:hypothetical protein
MQKQKNNTRYGLFYRSNGRWTTTPYLGATYTAYQLKRQPVKGDILELKNYVLKSKIRVKAIKN